MSSADEPALDPRVERLAREVLGPLFAADGSQILSVRTEEGGFVMELAGAMAGCPALELTQRHVIEPAFERALGERVRVRLTVRPVGP